MRDVITRGDSWIAKPVPEIAPLIGVSVRQAWYLVHSGELPSAKIGAKRVVMRTDAEAWLRRKVEEETARLAEITAVA